MLFGRSAGVAGGGLLLLLLLFPRIVFLVTPEYDMCLFFCLFLRFLLGFIYRVKNVLDDSSVPSTDELRQHFTQKLAEKENHEDLAVEPPDENWQDATTEPSMENWHDATAPLHFKQNRNKSENDEKETESAMIAELKRNNIISLSTTTNSSLQRTKLDKLIYGFDAIKNDILNIVLNINNSLPVNNFKNPYLLIGPKACGKESFTRRLAFVLDREFIKISLYKASDPVVRIIRSIKQSKSKNPIIFLDDVNTMIGDTHGDPTAALIEMFQNSSAFYYTSANETFDLSQVLFILSARWMNGISNRLFENVNKFYVWHMSFETKMQTALRHLIPKILDDLRLTDSYLRFEEQTLRYLVIMCTADPGIETLYGLLLCAMSNAARLFLDNPSSPIFIDENFMLNFCQISIRLCAKTTPKELMSPGSVACLSGSVGGGVFYVQATKLNGTGKLTITGIDESDRTMYDSVLVAVSWWKSNAWRFGVDIHENSFDIHVHFPPGAVPKTGPSASVAVAIALVSRFTNQCARSNTAVTGEITLTGSILPVGDIPMKMIAAIKNGFDRVILPDENFEDIKILPNELKVGRYHKEDKLTIIYAYTIEEAVKSTLVD